MDMRIQKKQANIYIKSFESAAFSIPSSVEVPSYRRSTRATFRKFLAEAQTQINWASPGPSIHFSTPSGELREAFLETIRQAKISIVCMTFTFSDPELIELLVQKAEVGVKVAVAIDKGHENFLWPYRDKITLITKDASQGRLHHKIMVVDQEKIWIGSANFSPEALLKQNNTMIHLESKELALALHQELEALSGVRKRNPVQPPPIKMEGHTIELLLFPRVPFGVANSPEKMLNEAGKKRIIEMIDSAKTSLRFAVSVWTDPDLASAVIRAKQRGVAVQVLVWKKSDSREIVSLFEREKILVIEKPHLTLMHNKWALIDNEHFLNCSANWSKSWFARNDESAILIHSLTLQEQQSLNDCWNELSNS